MVTDLQIVYLVLAGIIGTLVAIGLGWSESSEALDVKKFVASFLRGVIGIVIYIIGAYAVAETIGIFDYVEVAIFAAGFDILLKRGQAVLQKPQQP